MAPLEVEVKSWEAGVLFAALALEGDVLELVVEIGVFFPVVFAFAGFFFL